MTPTPSSADDRGTVETRPRGTTSPVSAATLSASSAYSVPRTSSTSASAAYAYMRAGCDPAARPADSAPSAASRASGVPRLAAASAARPRAHASRTPAPRRRNSPVAASAAVSRPSGSSVAAHAPARSSRARPHRSCEPSSSGSSSIGRGAACGARRNASDRPSLASHGEPARSASSTARSIARASHGCPDSRAATAAPSRAAAHATAPASPESAVALSRRWALPTSPAASNSSPRATGAAGSSSLAASRAPSTGSRTRPVRSAPTASGVGMATGSSQAAIRCRSRRGASAARDGPNAVSARTYPSIAADQRPSLRARRAAARATHGSWRSIAGGTASTQALCSVAASRSP